jgi:riboflavin synthase alpha subunit
MKPNYIFVKPYYISLRDIVEPKNTILEYKPFSDWWETDNEVYDKKFINHLLNKGYIYEQKVSVNLLKKQIIDAYCRIRMIDNTIPDEVLDFMKNAALEKLETDEVNKRVKEKLNEIPY